jgi:hypothetical protein
MDQNHFKSLIKTKIDISPCCLEYIEEDILVVGCYELDTVTSIISGKLLLI